MPAGRRYLPSWRSLASAAAAIAGTLGLVWWYLPAAPPFWVTVLVPLAVAVPRTIPEGRRACRRAYRWQLPRARRRAGQCVRCGYDLRGSPGRCPECGRVPLGRREPGPAAGETGRNRP